MDNHIGIIYILVGALLSYVSQYIGVIIYERRNVPKTPEELPEIPNENKDALATLKEMVEDNKIIKTGEGVTYIQPNEELIEKELEKGHYSKGGVTIMNEDHERNIDRDIEYDTIIETNDASNNSSEDPQSKQ